MLWLRISNHLASHLMKTKNLGMLLLSIYLILGGLVGLFGIGLGQLSFLLPGLAIAAGICLLLGK